MKKYWILIFITLLLIPIAKATINIEGPSKDIYNIGDRLDIKLNIIHNEFIHGLLKIELNCGTTSPLLMKTITLEPNEPYSLEENLPIPPFLTGTCFIVSSIQSGEKIIDQTQSSSFIISNELIGNFEVNKKEAQLGEKIILTGKITKQDNTPLKGIINIYFKTNENTVSIETLEITNGNINYEFDTTAKPAGTYTIEISATDIYSNKYLSNELTFNLIDQLILELQIEKQEILPGSTFKLTGTVKDIKNNLVKTGKVKISLEDQLHLTEISKGKFSQKISIPETIKSGQHTIHTTIEDNFGNTAQKEISFTVIPVPTVLEIKASHEKIKPESTFKITAFVYDQAADPIKQKTKIELKNPKKQKILEKEIKTEEEINIEIPKSASPGLWTITGYSTGLKTKKQIKVEEVSSIDIELEGQLLKVTNTGNINYKEPIQITFKNEETELTKTIKHGLFGIKPTGFVTYDLGKYVKTGTYDILINNKEFNQIPITHTKSYTIFYLIPIALILILLILLFLTKHLKKKIKKKKEFKKAKEFAEKLRKEKPPLTNKELREKHKRDFLKSMLKQVEKHDKKIKKQLKFDFSPKKEPPKTFALFKTPRISSITTKQKPSITSTLQKPLTENQQKPLWRILRKKGLIKEPEQFKKPEEPKKGLFSMFD